MRVCKLEAMADDEMKPRKPLKLVLKHNGIFLKRKAESDVNLDNMKRMKIVIRRQGLKMVASHCYITKNRQLKALGEDAHFIAREEQTIGVADGVGGWAKKGIDSGEYARQLMENAIEQVHKLHDVDVKELGPNLVRILQEAFSKTKLQGASTACIATHKDGIFRAINVGDSGFAVFRDGGLLYKSRAQQRRFNCPFQLGNHEKCQRPSCAEEMEVAVEEGDVVVMATDGLWDNMYTSEMEQIVAAEKNGTPEELARKMAQEAYYHAIDKKFKSPFEVATANAGKTHKGGKVDDITVIVGKIIRSYDLQLHT